MNFGQSINFSFLAQWFVLFGVLHFEQIPAQNWIWSFAPEPNTARLSISRDPSNNFYFYNRSGWNAWSYPYNDTVIKRDVNGNVLWKYSVPPGMRVTSLVSPNNSGFYMGGSFTGTIAILNSTYTAVGYDSWFGKFDASGNPLWIKTILSNGENDFLLDMCWNQNELVMTGSLEDTAIFAGQPVPKQHGRDLFVAKVSSSGNLKQIKYSSSGNLNTVKVANAGFECESDQMGNIYLLSSSYGENYLDTFNLSHWSSNGYQPYSRNVIKLNDSLKVQYVARIEDCIYYCNSNSNLRVNSLGEVFFLVHFSYGQSGDDIDYTFVKKLDASGKYTGKYRPRPHLEVSKANSIEIDGCDNVYFTGFWRYNLNGMTMYSSMVIGQLSSSLTVNWYWEDSTANNVAEGLCLKIIDDNDVLITGVYGDSLNLAGLLTGSGYNNDFMARFQHSGQKLCASAVGIKALSGDQKSLIFPNPTSGRITLPADIIRVRIINITGQQVLESDGSGHGSDVSILPDGIYVVMLENVSGEKTTQKLVVRK